jgi:hypothetical protein
MKQTPLTLAEANDFVKKYHRHSIPTTGCRFAFGVIENEQLIGVAICGRPVARLLDDKKTLEILRVCTDGTRNANSFIYDKCRKIAGLIGYEKVITYTLQKESGASLKAIGATSVKASTPHGWDSKSRRRKEQKVYFEPKLRWELPIRL